MEDKKEFFKELKGFYVDFVGNGAKSVRKLAEIQKKYSWLYQRFCETVKISDDYFMEFCDEFPVEERDEVLLMLIKMGFLGRKINKLFELKYEEQKKLAKEMEDFEKRFSRN